MRLQEILQEGVFDDVRVKREDIDLSVLAHVDTNKRAKVLRQLPDDLFWDLHAEQTKRYVQMDKIYKDAWERLKELKNDYPDDIELNLWQDKPGFHKKKLRGAIGSKDHHETILDLQVRPGTEAEKQTNRILKRHSQYDRIRLAASLTTSFANEAKKRQQKSRREANQAAEEPFSEWKQKAPKLNDVEMPDKLTKPGATKPSLNNPATYADSTNVFAGHPAHFEGWSPTWKRRMLEMEDVLKRNGKKGFRLMYSAKVNPNPRRRKQPAGYFNFFIIGADGDFVWRKYQTSEANGGNWLYVPGKRVFATDFERLSKEKQDEIIKQI